MSKIEFDYNDKHIILGFDRDTVAQAENVYNISLGAIKEMRISILPNLFRASFMKYCPDVSPTEMDAIFDCMTNKQEMFMQLTKMYAEAVETLFEEPRKGKAISWAIV